MDHDRRYGDVEYLNEAETCDVLRNLRVALAYTYSAAAIGDRVIGDYKAAQREIEKARLHKASVDARPSYSSNSRKN